MDAPYEPIVDPVNPPPSPNRKSVLIVVFGVIGFVLFCCVIAGALVFSPSGAGKAFTATVVAGINEEKDSLTDPGQGGSEDPAESPVSKTLYKVGERANEIGMAVTVLSVQKADKFQYSQPGEGKTYLDVEVLIENVSRNEAMQYNNYDFRVKDNTAAEYSSVGEAIQPALRTGELAKGEKVRGHVAFEVPADSKDFILSFEASVPSGAYRVMRINLNEKTDQTAAVGEMKIGESQVGKRFVSSGVAVTILSVASPAMLDDTAPEAGTAFVDLEVLVENVNQGESMPYTPYYLRIKDAQFMEYGATFSALEPVLNSGDLVKGDKVRGHVAFQVPAKDKAFLVTYAPDEARDDFKPIKVNVVMP